MSLISGQLPLGMPAAAHCSTSTSTSTSGRRMSLRSRSGVSSRWRTRRRRFQLGVDLVHHAQHQPRRNDLVLDHLGADQAARPSMLCMSGLLETGRRSGAGLPAPDGGVAPVVADALVEGPGVALACMSRARPASFTRDRQLPARPRRSPSSSPGVRHETLRPGESVARGGAGLMAELDKVGRWRPRWGRWGRRLWGAGLHEVFALDAETTSRSPQPRTRTSRCRNRCRSSAPKREMVQRGTAEKQHRQHHDLGGTVGDDSTTDGRRDGVVDDLHGAHLAVAPKFSHGPGRRSRRTR